MPLFKVTIELGQLEQAPWKVEEQTDSDMIIMIYREFQLFHFPTSLFPKSRGSRIHFPSDIQYLSDLFWSHSVQTYLNGSPKKSQKRRPGGPLAWQLICWLNKSYNFTYKDEFGYNLPLSKFHLNAQVPQRTETILPMNPWKILQSPSAEKTRTKFTSD